MFATYQQDIEGDKDVEEAGNCSSDSSIGIALSGKVQGAEVDSGEVLSIAKKFMMLKSRTAEALGRIKEIRMLRS